jgi:NADPH:quinone reductase-like Zn-dependent oxidoreductase
MKAIRVRSTGGPEVLELDEPPDPVPHAMELGLIMQAVGRE